MPAYPPVPPELEEARRLVHEALDPRSAEALVALVSRLLREARSAREAALRDELTGLANRRALSDALRNGLAAARRYGEPLSVVLVDLDGFKALNDTHGHPAGDAALRAVAEILRLEIRAHMDLAARLGGDEFALLLPRTDLAGAIAVGERIAARVAEPSIALEGASLGASFGAAELGVGEDVEALVARADAALYVAKRARHAATRALAGAPG